MQSPNVFKTKSHKSPRNPFDLGHDDYFTKSAGLLSPIYCEDTLPGDYLKVNFFFFNPFSLISFFIIFRSKSIRLRMTIRTKIS